MRLGLREANQRFSQAIKAVKKGEEVILTERGKAIAIIKPINPEDDQEGILQRLEAEGILQPASKRGPLPNWKPVRIKGKPASQTLREERDKD
jgi:prevent-host-death family protein